MASTLRPARERRPVSVSLLAGIQFLAAAAGVVILLGNGTVDGELSGTDIGAAVGSAMAGAAVIGSTTGGGRPGWWLQLLLAPAAVAWWALTMAQDEGPGLPVAVFGAVWLLLLLLPPTRDWFVRPQPQR